MEKYYEDIIKDIQWNIENKKYQEAYDICKEELSSLYIPVEVEEILQTLERDCTYYISETKRSKYTQEDIDDLFMKDDAHVRIAIELLKKSNVREYIDVIEAYLKKNPDPLLRSYLIELLISQGVNEDIEMQYDGLQVTFSPIFCEEVKDQDIYQQMVSILKSYYEGNDPIFLSMCLEVLEKEMLLRQPFSIDEEEIDMMIYAVLKYVYEASNNIKDFNIFVEEKSLAKYNSYALLLCRYVI